ncbi:MAG: MFS transporter [Eggerthellaceae bacterium]|jgi:MFS family permease
MDKKVKSKRPALSQAMVFILLFGIVSLFSDMTHEGADSIRGAYLVLLGASAGTIGFISGLGELIGYSLRLIFGKLADKTKAYWPLLIAGYVIDIVAVPALAFVGEHGWIAACALLALQKFGKSIKKPAKDTVMSFAASQEGAGKTFGIQEMLDQIGAFLGPVLLYVVMLFKTSGTTYEIYSFCFLVLAIPGAITLILLGFTKAKFPNPDQFEPEAKQYTPLKMKRSFVLYIIGISVFAFGFMDYALVLMHVEQVFVNNGTQSLITEQTLPLLYAAAMLIDAIAALVFGSAFDKHGVKVLAISAFLSALFPVFIFTTNSLVMLFVGIALWGIGMGAQESILKAMVTSLIPKQNRATGYGIFECSFGVCWFFGSWLLGSLYDISIPLMIAISLLTQLASIPFYLAAGKKEQA